MARPGVYARAPEWWRHLRRAKRVFWKRERKAAARDAQSQCQRDPDE